MPRVGDEVRPLSGEMFKLESARGGVLGTITIPVHWGDSLRENGEVRFMQPLEISYGAFGLEGNNKFPSVRVGSLVRSYGRRDAVSLWGLTLEEFEKIDGCSFSPSAAYLRSIVE